MSKKKWKVAVIGCGSFANSQYLPNISTEANAECVAAVDIVFERAEAACKKYGIPNAYHDVYELIEKCDFDIAIDAASIQAHHEINMAILGAGKHLISQKPAAPDVEHFNMQIELAKKNNVKFVCVPVHPMRYDLAIAKQMINDGAIGEPGYLKCNLAHGGPEYFQYRDVDPSWFYEDGAGALVDMGVHGLQIVTTVFGPVKKMSCLAAITDPARIVRSGRFNGKQLKTDKIPDVYLISLTFANGKIGFVDTGFSQKASKTPSLEIYGTKGTISFTEHYMTNPIPEVYIDSKELGLRGWVKPDTWETIPRKIKSQCCCLTDIIEAIENNTEPVLSPEHARHILEIMQKIPEAIKTGATVDLETEF
jgi:UDP-N-acetyl-2-amino-2-deoxyglucuronate dehydrogenase